MSVKTGMLKSLFKNRDMIIALTIRDFKGLYKNSHLGIIWQFLTPVIMVLLFYIVFTSIRTSSTSNPNFWIILCVGIFPYVYMETSIISGSRCIINNASLITKVSFPREVIPAAHVLTALLTFIITFTIVIAITLSSGHDISYYNIILVVPLTALVTLFNLGITFLLSSIVVYFHDLAHFITSISRLLFWTAPTIYTVYDVSGLLKTIMLINPLTPFITCYHDLIYYNIMPSFELLTSCITLAALFFIVGSTTFNKLKYGFAERL